MAKQIKATDVFESEDIFKGIRESAEQAIATLGKFKKELAGTADDLKKTIGGASMGDTKGINELITATNKANDVKEKTIKIDQEQERLRKLAAQAEKEEIRVKKEALTLAEKEQRAKDKELKQAQQQESIYAQQSKRLNELRRAYKDLAFQNKENTAEAQKLISEITDLDTKLKKVDATVGQHQRNVGNYEGATMSLRTELRKLTQELANLDESDPRFNQMAQRAGELRDRMQDTQGVIKATAGTGLENFAGAMANVGQVGIAAFQGIESAMVLMGVENENLMKAMVRLQALAGLADAMRTLGGLGDMMTEIKAGFIAAAQKLGILVVVKDADVVATEAQTAALTQQEVATNKVDAATGKMQLTMKALPVALIATAIIALIANFDKIAALFDRVSMKNKVLNETMGAYADAAKNVIKETTEVKASFELARQGVISKEEALDKYNTVLGDTFGTAKNLNEAEKLYAEKTAAYVQATSLRAQADAIFQKVAEERVKALMAHRTASKAAKIESDDFLSITNGLSKGLKESGYRANQNANELEKLAMSLLKSAEVLENENKIRSEYDQKVTKSSEKKKKAAKEEKIDLDTLTAAFRKATQARLELLNIERKALDPKEVEKMMILDEERAVQIADLAVIEAEIALKRAQNTGNTKQIQAAEKALFDARKKQIEEQLKLQLAQTDDVNEQERLRKEAQLKIMNLQKEETKDLQKQAEIRNSWAKYTADYFIEQSNRKIAQIDKEIAAAENQQNILQELAANGNINAKESLAEQQKIIDQANRRKEQEQRRQQMIELISGVYQTYNSKVAEGAEHPLMETIRDTVMLQQFANTLLGQMPAFLEGTEDTGTNGYGVDGKGGFHAILHPNERVVPKSLNEQIGSMSNEQLARLAQEYQNGKLIRGSQAGSSMELALLANKLDTLTDTIKQKPETNIELGEITSSMMEIVKSTKQGNTLKTNRYKIRK
jgi:hypothetical protein